MIYFETRINKSITMVIQTVTERATSKIVSRGRNVSINCKFSPSESRLYKAN